MKCEEAAEFVSALCDGESIPPVAAEHIGACETCRGRMKEYAEIDAELRRLASLESRTEARARTLETRRAQTWLPETDRAYRVSKRFLDITGSPVALDDVKFVTPGDDQAATTVHQNGGLSAVPTVSAPSTTLSPNPWMRILDALEKNINRHSYDTWLKPTRYSHSSGGILFVRVPTAEFRHAGDKYADLIQEAIDNLGLEFSDVKFVTPEDDPAATTLRHNGGLSALPAATAPAQARFDWDGAAQLNPRTLSTLSSSARGNQFAHAACQAVAERLQSLQPALPLWRRRHGQDAPDAGHRPRSQTPPAAGRHLLRLQREVHQ